MLGVLDHLIRFIMPSSPAVVAPNQAAATSTFTTDCPWALHKGPTYGLVFSADFWNSTAVSQPSVLGTNSTPTWTALASGSAFTFRTTVGDQIVETDSCAIADWPA